MGRHKNAQLDKPAGARRQWAADRALRTPMRSPGRPEPSRAVQRQFWRLIATGVTTVDAAATVGVSSPVAIRWFRHAGGMTPISLDEPLGRYLSFDEREEISFLRSKKPGCMRSRVNLTATRERFLASYGVMLLPAGASQSIELGCCASQWKAQQAAKRLKVAKLVTNLPCKTTFRNVLQGSCTKRTVRLCLVRKHLSGRD